MIAPEPYKLICPNCGFTKIVKPKSDAYTSAEILPFCSKCNSIMIEERINKMEDNFSNEKPTNII